MHARPRLLILLFLLTFGCGPKTEVDLLLVNGRIVTAGDGFPIYATLAVKEGVVHAVGDHSLARHYRSAKRINLNGKTVLPGFNDTHQHVRGRPRRHLELGDLTSLKDLHSRIQTKAEELGPGEWITGYGWAEDDLSEKRRPLRWDLDEAAPENPVILSRAGGHSAVASSLALKLAEIDRNTPDPEGGVIERDDSGDLNGIIRERAGLVYRLVPNATWEELKPSFINNLEHFLSLGITSFIQAGATIEEWGQWQEVYNEHGEELPRATVQIRWTSREKMEASGLMTGQGDDHLRVGAVKILADGGFTGPAAYTIDPYKGRKTYRGKMNYSDEALETIIFDAHETGWQLGFHAIGDAAIKMTVEMFVDALEKWPRGDHRHYLNHFTVSPPAETYRLMAMHGIHIAQQPNFTWTLDSRYMENLDDDRLELNNPLRTPMDYGIFVALGSDILPTGPFQGLHSSVTRLGKTGRVFGPGEHLSMEEAILGYTRNGAFLTFEENIKGTLEPGMLADFVILSQDILSVPAEKIRRTAVEKTYVGGKLVYDASKSEL